MLNQYTSLLLRSRAYVSDEDRALMKRFISRFKSIASFVESKKDLARSFMRIEKVQSKEPLSLFARNVPVIVFNRISFYEDREGKNPLFSFIMDELSFNKMLFSFSSSEYTPATAESEFGYQLKDYVKPSDRPAVVDRARLMMKDKENRKDSSLLSIALNDMEKEMAEKGRISANLFSEVEKFTRSTSPDRYRSFCEKIHFENLDKLATEYKVEACGIMSYQHGNSSPLLLESPVQEPMAFSKVMEAFPVEEMDAFKNAFHSLAHVEAKNNLLLAKEKGDDVNISIIEDFIKSLGDPEFTIPKSIYRGYDGDLIAIHSTLYNNVGNQHIRDTRSDYQPLALCVQTSRYRTSNPVQYHSDYPSLDKTIFEFNIKVAYVDDEFGSENVRGYDNVIQFTVTENDLINMIQASYLETYVPVLIQSIGYNRIEHNLNVQEDNSFSSRVDNSITETEKELANEMNKIGQFLGSCIKTKPKNKAEREHYIAELKRYIALSHQLLDENIKNAEQTFEQSIQAVKSDVEGCVQVMASSANNPNLQQIKQLLLAKKD